MPKDIQRYLRPAPCGRGDDARYLLEDHRSDGVVQGFTDHMRDLEVDGITDKAASGYTRTAIRSTADLAMPI
jgi:hypothetical protein